MPKTHTPGSRLEKRGSRFYSAEMGRWVSKDPIGEEGGINVYLFANNAPFAWYDAIGLLSKTTTYHYNVPSTQMMTMPDGTRAAGSAQVTVWQFAYSSESCGFLWLKQRLVDYDPKVAVEIKINADFTPGTQAGGGYTILTHEEHHRDIDYSWATRLDGIISPYIGWCVCPPCFGAMNAYLSAIKQYYGNYRDYENKQFDCSVYPPGPNRTSVCNAANTLASTLNTQYANVVVPAKTAMDNACK